MLRDVDTDLNQRGVQKARYIDDFVILGSNERSVQKAWAVGEAILKSLGLEAHLLAAGGEKTLIG